MDSFFMFELLEYEHTIHQSKVYITRISQNIQTLKRQPPTLKHDNRSIAISETESKLTFSKRKYVLILQKLVLKNRKGELLDGICIILDVLERLREYDNIVNVLTSILSVPEGAASRQRGKQILQLCMKRWKDDEFIPFEAEYALKQLKAQHRLSQNALKQAIKVQ